MFINTVEPRDPLSFYPRFLLFTHLYSQTRLQRTALDWPELFVLTRVLYNRVNLCVINSNLTWKIVCYNRVFINKPSLLQPSYWKTDVSSSLSKITSRLFLQFHRWATSSTLKINLLWIFILGNIFPILDVWDADRILRHCERFRVCWDDFYVEFKFWSFFTLLYKINK